MAGYRESSPPIQVLAARSTEPPFDRLEVGPRSTLAAVACIAGAPPPSRWFENVGAMRTDLDAQATIRQGHQLEQREEHQNKMDRQITLGSRRNRVVLRASGLALKDVSSKPAPARAVRPRYRVQDSTLPSTTSWIGTTNVRSPARDRRNGAVRSTALESRSMTSDSL